MENITKKHRKAVSTFAILVLIIGLIWLLSDFIKQHTMVAINRYFSSYRVASELL